MDWSLLVILAVVLLCPILMWSTMRGRRGMGGRVMGMGCGKARRRSAKSEADATSSRDAEVRP